MTLEAIFGSEKKMIVIISVLMIAAGVLANFIVAIVWWSRLHPWFSHAAKSGKTVYSSLTASWVFCLVAIIVLALIAVFKFLVQSIYEKIGENRLMSIVVIGVVSVLSVAIVICTIIPASFALQNKTDESGDKEKCYRYFLEGIEGIEAYFEKKYGDDGGDDWEYKYLNKYLGDEIDPGYPKDYQDFMIWYIKIFSHIAKGENEPSNYLCAEVGAPALVFTLILLIGVILFLVVAIPVFKGSSDGGNNSENENPQE